MAFYFGLMPINDCVYLALLHKTASETAVLAREQSNGEHVKLMRLIPFNEETHMNLKLLMALNQQRSICIYQEISTFTDGSMIRTTEEFLGETSLCERILPYTLCEKSLSTEDIKQLAQEIVDVLDKIWVQLSQLVTDKSKLVRILLSSLNLHNITFLPSIDGDLSSVYCVLKGLGISSGSTGDSDVAPTSISVGFGRLLYCMLTASVQDTLPIHVMTKSLSSCIKEEDPLREDLVNLAIECLTKHEFQISTIKQRLHADRYDHSCYLSEVVIESPSFALSPPLSPQRSPSPLPLSLSELLLDKQQHYTPLMIAIISNQVHTARIVYKDFLRKRDAHRNTALMLAVLCNNIPLVELLAEYENGCTNVNGDTALLIAITHGFYECCIPLFKYEILVPNSVSGVLPRQIAFESCQHAILDAIIAFDSVPRDTDGCTALMRAAMDGHSVDEFILEQFGCTHDNSNGYTALMFAIVNGNEDACKKLMKYEGSISDSTGKSPLEIAVLSHQTACSLVLLRNNQNPTFDIHANTDLVDAIITDQWSLAENLLKQLISKRQMRKNAAAFQSQQKTSIHSTIKIDKNGNTELMKYLATESLNNIECEKKHWQALIPTHAGYINKIGETALYIAIKRGIASAIPFLVPYEMHIRDNYGRLPLRQAVELHSAVAIIAILDTLHLVQNIHQRLHISKLIDCGNWSALTRFFEDSPDTSALL